MLYVVECTTNNEHDALVHNSISCTSTWKAIVLCSHTFERKSPASIFPTRGTVEVTFGRKAKEKIMNKNLRVQILLLAFAKIEATEKQLKRQILELLGAPACYWGRNGIRFLFESATHIHRHSPLDEKAPTNPPSAYIFYTISRKVNVLEPREENFPFPPNRNFSREF